jgi:intermediate cleaving peptidase 55
MTEAQLHATLEYYARMEGASGLAYVPVVASGKNSLVLHYVKNACVMKDGDLVLVDAGAEYNFYCSDVSRTWPVNGKFTEPQRKLYELVLNCQKQIILKCKPGSSLDELQNQTYQYLHEGVSELLGRHIKSMEMQDLYPHHVGHYIGLDVHDCYTVSRSKRLKPGMAVTIEPGIYIPDDPKYGTFRGIGVRIEDDIVITEDEPLVLTSRIPKEIHELESLFQ